MSNIIISGANRGIGYYIVEQLLADGNNVAVLDIETNNLNELHKQYGEKLSSYICDIRDNESVEKSVNHIMEKFETVDIAVQNACLCTFQSFENTNENTYKDVFDVNYFGALRLSKAVIPYMKKQKNGKIIFTSSGVGVTGFVNISPYASSKGAIEALAKCLEIEYKNYGITFHIFHPPLTLTKSAEPLPVPNEFMAKPKAVGNGLAKHIKSKSFIICHSFSQKIQTKLCYCFSIKMGTMMSKMTEKYIETTQNNN